MSEDLVLHLLPEHISRLGFKNYRIRYRDLLIKAATVQNISASNELWFILDDPESLKVESDYGIYDTQSGTVLDNVHIHRGELILSNESELDRRIKFLQVIIIN